MKPSIIYWILAAVFGILHLHFLLTAAPFAVPVYVSALVPVAAAYILYRKIPLEWPALGKQWHIMPWCFQLLLAGIYMGTEPSWIYAIPFACFLLVEFFRLRFSREAALLLNQAGEFDKERRQMNDTFRVMRSERHDFLKHIAALHFMLDNKNYTDAKEYLDELVADYKQTNLSIKGERGTTAGILNHMYKRAQAAGVEVIYDLDLPLSTLPLSDKEMVVLLGNVLSNSIEACEEWQREHNMQAALTLQFYKRSGLYLLICKNNSLPIPARILDNLFNDYGLTTKEGNHEGLGTKMIHDTVKKHHGFLDYIYKNEEFTVKIKIPAIR